jgi:hypothetical protein
MKLRSRLQQFGAFLAGMVKAASKKNTGQKKGTAQEPETRQVRQSHGRHSGYVVTKACCVMRHIGRHVIDPFRCTTQPRNT